MKKILAWLLFFINVDLVHCIPYVFSAGKISELISQKITASPQVSGLLNQYYVCGVAFPESSFSMCLFNCGCRRNGCKSKSKYKCNFCDDLSLERKAVKVKFCHKDAWDNQVTKIFTTGHTESQNWQQMSCPKFHYVTGIGISFVRQQEVNSGIYGTRLRCENTDFTSKSFLQDSKAHFFTEMSKNPAKTFLTGFQFGYLPNEKITGLRGYFSQQLKLFSVSIVYGNAQPTGNTTLKTIELKQKENREFDQISSTIGLENSHSVTDVWILDLKQEKQIQFPEGTVIDPPVVNGSQVSSNTYYKVAITPATFQFDVPRTTTYSPAASFSTSIPWCYTHKVISTAELVKARANFTLNLNYINPTTNETITKAVTGIWEGQIQKQIQTSVSNTEIQGCKQIFYNPSSVSIKYGDIQLIQNKTTRTIETFLVENRNTNYQGIAYTIAFYNTYSVTQTFKNNIEEMNNVKIPEAAVIYPPKLNGTNYVENQFFKPTSTPFSFKTVQTITYRSELTVPTSIHWCYVQKGIAYVDEQMGRGPYTMTLTYLNSTTNETKTRKITGVWEGYIYNPIKTETPSSTEIPDCKTD